MLLKHYLAVAGLFIPIFAWVPGSHAAERSVIIEPRSLFVDGAASSGLVVGLPKNAISNVYAAITLPADYATNTQVRIRIYTTTVSTTPCSAVIRLLDAVRQRINQTDSVSFYPNIDRITPVAGEPISYASGFLHVKTYVVRPPSTGAISGQRAGDHFVLRFQRAISDPMDTCGSTIFIRALDVRYTYVP